MFQCNWDWIHEGKQLMVKREIEKEKRSKPIFHFFDIIIGMVFYYISRKNEFVFHQYPILEMSNISLSIQIKENIGL